MKAANETASRITKPERIERVVLFIITKSINFQWYIQISPVNVTNVPLLVMQDNTFGFLFNLGQDYLFRIAFYFRLLPFLSDGPEEVFWFDFAIGTIAGMAFSVIAIILVLPVFCVRKRY